MNVYNGITNVETCGALAGSNLGGIVDKRGCLLTNSHDGPHESVDEVVNTGIRKLIGHVIAIIASNVMVTTVLSIGARLLNK